MGESELPAGDAGLSFVERLPVDRARRCFHAWNAARAMRATDGRPELKDFAPHRLPPECLPWLTIHREQPGGEVVYGLVGQELIDLFGSNPRGKPVLANAAPAERAARLAGIREAMQTACPAWFTGALSFENHVALPVGRLVLPAQAGADRLLVLIYFLLSVAAPGRPRPLGSASFDSRDVTWCPAAELAAPGPAPA
ncbi:PAS domain-containing protein [Desertibaculum subflavum]|uniref:PAS domain-containing protein n=1 Tax=Desertibaculum subflavum TaxID=2268458 RepID=UPI000E676587